MSNLQQRLRADLIARGKNAFCMGEHARSEKYFTALKLIEPNAGRLYLAVVYISQSIPGKLKDADEREANAQWFVRADAEYHEVLADKTATAEERDIAERGLKAITSLRATDIQLIATIDAWDARRTAEQSK